jgi:CRISPR-associated endonuclease/helicase Cas3
MELVDTATRGTAVACVQIGENGTTLAWIVGRRDPFSRQGTLVNAKAAASNVATAVTFSATPKILALSVYAALRHDIGKANAFMAEKLSLNHHEPDPIRHEILSYLISKELESSPDTKFSALFEAAARKAKKLNQESPFIDFPADEHALTNWLVATHHRLPRGLAGCATYDNHITESNSKDTKANLTCAGDLLRDQQLLTSLKRDATWSDKTFDSSAEVESLFIWSRLALMLGDHHASSLPLPEGRTGLYANSSNADRPAQDLAQHLLATERFTGKAVRVLGQLSSRLPALYPEDRKEISKPSPIRGGSSFGWQNIAVTAARQITKAADYGSSGTFAVLCASTGSGKTRAGTKIMSALSGDRMRLSTLLGLRSLTLQTGDAYADETSIPREYLAVLIGSREVRNLHSAEKRRKKGEALHSSTQTETSVENGIGTVLPSVIETQIKSDDDRRMLCSPILVCTIDYLIGGADWSRSKHILPQLRLMTSDVILDEIDGYNLEDYPAIARLCYLVGLFGRRLMLSSATAMPEIVSPLYKAYEAGWRAHAKLTGASDNIYTLFVADSVSPSMLKVSASMRVEHKQEHWFKSHYQAFTERVAMAAHDMQALRRGIVANISNIPNLLAAIADLHTKNHRESESTPGIEVSCGLVRIARVTDTVAISRALVRLGPQMLDEHGIFIQVLPYHANLTTAVRAWVEGTLDDLLKRKPGRTDPVAQHSIANIAKARGAKKAVLLVVATPVEEVGRDHDFDWAVIEPSSSRSIVQCAGRVNRHRRIPLEDGQVNIAVMRRNLRDQEGRERSFWGPGFEPKTKPFASHDISEIAAHLVNRPDAEACLASDIADNLPLWEREIIESTLESSITTSFVEPLSAKLTDEHFSLHGFRAGATTTDVYYSFMEKRWKDSETGTPLHFEPASIFPEDHWLIDMKDGLQRIVSEIAGRLGLDYTDEQFSKKYMRVGLAEYYYDNVGRTLTHPLVGIFKENPKSVLK